ncbi:esterase [Brevibacillus nitrificans]|uniref:Esterase n=1 Tax=Brevibacillus nitrificans TaxID=651560 RepID=A0A3M8D621_9BACL|nr:alpha/beta hydrolase [Brevibacillus nitrificans]RNB83179.1 esterase [Brevibacillus nitrificans]
MANLTPNAVKHVEMFQGMSSFPTMEPKAVRDLLAQAPPLEVELAPLAKVEDRRIPVESATDIRIRIYTPEGNGPFPLFLYFHGGGWVIGDIEMTDASCRLIANRTGRVVVSVSYRLAPEHPYPTPVNDCYAALQWVANHADELSANASNLVVGGDSAGGNLAAVVALKARDQKGPAIAAQVLIYPVTSLDYTTGSYEQFQEGFGLDRELMKWFGQLYVTREEDLTHPYVAPLLAEDVSSLPPAYIITAENDVLRDEGQAYARRLQEAGVRVESICEEGLVHGYFSNLLLFSDRIEEAIAKMDRFLTETTK